MVEHPIIELMVLIVGNTLGLSLLSYGFKLEARESRLEILVKLLGCLAFVSAGYIVGVI